MITKEEAKRFHAAAKMIEDDGPEGYYSCRRQFGTEIAGAVLVTWTRARLCDPNVWPDQGLMERTDKALRKTGRLE